MLRTLKTKRGVIIAFLVVLGAFFFIRSKDLIRSPRLARAKGQLRSAMTEIGRRPILLWPIALAGVCAFFTTNFAVVLTAFATDAYVLGALRAGAAGFLLKHTPPPQLVDAVRQAAAGTMTLSPEAITPLLDAASAPQVEGVERVASLSDREAEVADLVAEGLTNADIAARLYLSLPTVKTHLARIFEKLAVTNRVQLALLVHAARRA